MARGGDGGAGTKTLLLLVLGVGATVGAGSAVSKDVGAGELAVARGKQVAIKNWKRPQKVLSLLTTLRSL